MKGVKISMMNKLSITSEEIAINGLLQLTLKTYFALKRKGKGDLATTVLRIGSRNAILRMEQAGIKSHKVFCPKCKKQIKEEVEFVNETGRCLRCDHLEGDYEN